MDFEANNTKDLNKSVISIFCYHYFALGPVQLPKLQELRGFPQQNQEKLPFYLLVGFVAVIIYFRRSLTSLTREYKQKSLGIS